MNFTMLHIYTILEIIMLVILSSATLYIFVFAVAGHFYRQPKYPSDPKLKKIAVLIPGYKEDNVIIDVAKDALQQDYPKELFEVIIIADSFKAETLEQLRELPVQVVEVRFEKSTKAKALNKAMFELPVDYKIAVVLDADNLMAPGFLWKVNAAFDDDFMAVQGHRMAKNLNNSLAILDAASEEINNHIFRKGHRALGLSSAIIGSGMAFRYGYFKYLMSGVTAVGGFDKELELLMLKDRHKIAYLDDAFVMDEKVQKEEVFSNQRRRWLSAQFHYFRKDILPALRDLIFKGNVDYFDKAFQFIQPPRILLLGIMVILGIVFPLLNHLAGLDPWISQVWMIAAGLCVLTFFLSVPRSFYNMETVKALFSLPRGMLLMLTSLLKIKGANRQFIHTQHGIVNPPGEVR